LEVEVKDSQFEKGLTIRYFLFNRLEI